MLKIGTSVNSTSSSSSSSTTKSSYKLTTADPNNNIDVATKATSPYQNGGGDLATSDSSSNSTSNGHGLANNSSCSSSSSHSQDNLVLYAGGGSGSGANVGGECKSDMMMVATAADHDYMSTSDYGMGHDGGCSSKTNLIVNYLPHNMTQDEIKELFASIGPVETCKLIKDKLTGQSLGYAFVNFVNPDDADKAISSFNGMRLQNKTIKVSLARPSSELIKGANLYVCGIPKDFTQADLERMFYEFGTIISSKILTDPKTGEPKGVGFVRFDKRIEAESAIEKLNGKLYENIPDPLVVKFANSPTSVKSVMGIPLAPYLSTAAAASCRGFYQPYRSASSVSSYRYSPMNAAPPPTVVSIPTMSPLPTTTAAALAAAAAAAAATSPLTTAAAMTSVYSPMNSLDAATSLLHNPVAAAAALAALNGFATPATSPTSATNLLPVAASCLTTSSTAPSLATLGTAPILTAAATNGSATPNTQSAVTAAAAATTPTGTHHLIQSPPPSSMSGHSFSHTHTSISTSAAAPNYVGWCIFVYNLSPESDESLLWQLFGPFGAVQNVKVIRDLQTFKSKGFGFVTMNNYEEACTAINCLNGINVQNRILQVSFKTNTKQMF